MHLCSPLRHNFPTIGVLGSLILLPVVHWSGVSLAAAIPKTAVFSGFTLITSAILIWQLHTKEALPVPRKTIVWALVLMIVSGLLSAIVSGNFPGSLFGTYVRGLGMIDLATCILFGWCVFILFDPGRLRSISWAISTAGALAVVAGIAEILSGGTDLRALVGVPMGHPNFLGQLLTLTIPASVGLSLIERHRLRWLAVALLIIQAAGLFLAGSRAALLGVIVGCTLWAFVSIGGSFVKKSIILGGVLTILTLLFIVANVTPMPSLRSVPLFSRLILSSENGGVSATQSLSVRGYLWKMALKAIGERPLLGYGDGGIASALEQHLDQRVLALERYDALPDSAHSWILDRLVQRGFLGLALSMVLIVLVIRSGVSAWTVHRSFLLRALVIGLIGWSTTQLFGFPSVVDLFFAVAMIAVILRMDAVQQLNRKIALPIALLLIGITAFALSDDIRSLAADRWFHQWEVSSDRAGSFAILVDANRMSPRLAYAAHLATEQMVRGEDADALATLNGAIASNGEDPRLLVLRAKALLRLHDTDAAGRDAARATSLAPRTPFVWRTWGVALSESGMAKDAVDVIGYSLGLSSPYWQWDGTLTERTAIERAQYETFFRQNPDFRSIFLFLGHSCFELGDSMGALEALSHAPRDVPSLSTIGVILGSQGKTKEALAVFEEALRMEPENEILQENVRILREE